MDINSVVEDAVDKIKETLQSGISEQIRCMLQDQPYSCACRECGGGLGVSTEVDEDLDLVIFVERCDCGGIATILEKIKKDLEETAINVRSGRSNSRNIKSST